LTGGCNRPERLVLVRLRLEDQDAELAAVGSLDSHHELIALGNLLLGDILCPNLNGGKRI
jgi:hypothetical protein